MIILLPIWGKWRCRRWGFSNSNTTRISSKYSIRGMGPGFFQRRFDRFCNLRKIRIWIELSWVDLSSIQNYLITAASQYCVKILYQFLNSTSEKLEEHFLFCEHGILKQNLHWKLGQQSAIVKIYLGIFRDYSLINVFFRNKTFSFFKIESWNFQHLFKIELKVLVEALRRPTESESKEGKSP